MRNDTQVLFNDGSLEQALRHSVDSLRRKVESISPESFAATSTDTLIERLVAENHVAHLVLNEAGIQKDGPIETKMDVTGHPGYGSWGRSEPMFTDAHKLTFYVPFTGEASLWKLTPSSFTSNLPRGHVDSAKSVLVIEIEHSVSTPPERYMADFTSQISNVRTYVEAQRRQIEQQPQALADRARIEVERRRKALEQLTGLAASIPFPMVKKAGMPDFTPLHLPRKIIRPLPPAPKAGYVPEPAISAEQYAEILSIIRHAGHSFEGAPQTYLPLGEDGLRDNMLSHLNVVYGGAATGETFRKFGKTDIRIQDIDEKRSAFVGECKLWGGPKLLSETLDQLLGYLTWRDCKAAMIFFNKSVAGFTALQDSVRPTLATHKGFLREHKGQFPGEWRFDFQSADDALREVTVHVFLFDLYVPPARTLRKR